MPDPEHEAARILNTVWGSESKLPVDPVRIARELGIDVREARLDPGVGGQLVKRIAADPIIYLNREDAKNRKRFTCAHELGHFNKRSVSPSLFDVQEYEYVDSRDKLATTGANPDEVYANKFAAALLMPAKEVRRLRRQNLSVTEMAYRFDVSIDAMRFRLENLGLAVP